MTLGAIALAVLASACTHGAAGDAGLDADVLDVPARDDTVQYPPPYATQVFDQSRITSQSGAPNFQHIEAPLAFDGGPFAHVSLVIDLATTCYPFEQWRTDPPPPGQNWPSDCDAFDRNFEFTLDEPATPGQPPAIELERAITPFGGPEHFEVDITDVANGLPGMHTLRATIPTYADASGRVTGSNGGWTVSARVEFTPGDPPHHVLAVIPVFNLSADATGSTMDFGLDVPAGTQSSRFEYRATGHGGATVSDPACIGPAEEFCDRTHTLRVDGTVVYMMDLWRDDCDQNCTVSHFGPQDGGFDYCMQNPCGDMNSVRAPRANWCPGTETPPLVQDIDALHVAGHHTVGYALDTIANGGSWRLSGVYFAFGP